MFQTKQRIGPYLLVRELGRGAFGSVWLAQEQNLLKREVALKLPLDEDPDLEMIEQEAQLWLRAGNHPNVVPVLNADVYNEQVAIVSEYVSGGTLTKWLKLYNGKALPIAEAVAMICGILSGLEHLHSLKPHALIHRDLKPANVLIDQYTQRPRITDFGISRILKTTNSTNISGTPAYMAPEMFEGHYSTQSDIWAVGIMLYQMLDQGFDFPFKGANMVQLARSIERDEPKPLPNTVPEMIREAIQIALQKDPSGRFDSASDMQNWLSYAITNEDSTIEPVPAPVQPSYPTAASVGVLYVNNQTEQPQTEHLYVPVEISEETCLETAAVDVPAECEAPATEAEW